MTGRIIHLEQGPHDCQHPPAGSNAHGTWWQCDCGDKWIALASMSLDEIQTDTPFATWWARWPGDEPGARLGARPLWWRAVLTVGAVLAGISLLLLLLLLVP